MRPRQRTATVRNVLARLTVVSLLGALPLSGALLPSTAAVAAQSSAGAATAPAVTGAADAGPASPATATRGTLPAPADVPAPAADGVRVGAGSYAPTPPSTISDAADVQKTVDQQLYIDPSQAGKPVPTNQWWTDLLVSRFSGDMWAYPFVTSNSAAGTKLTIPTRWNADGTAMRLEAPITVSGTVTPTPDASDRVLADFEGGLPDGWTATGSAFSRATGTAPGQSQVAGWLGDGYLSSWGTRDGDGATGSLTSPDFTLDRSTLAFLVAGGAHPDQEAVQLVVGDQVVASATGENSEAFSWVQWDVRAWAGQRAHLRVVDSLPAGWAHVMVDQVMLTDQPEGIAQRSSTAFDATAANALRWGDWNVSWRMPQAGSGGQYMDVTSVQGSPYQWFEYHGETPRITVQAGAQVTDADGDPIRFPFTGDRFEIRQGGHVFGVHAPAHTVFTRTGDAIDASAGTPHLVVSAVPTSGLTLDELHATAFAVPRDTRMDYAYDPAAGKVTQRWDITTDALEGTGHDTVQGWLQHQYADTTNNLRFTGATYATPRGTLKTTVGHGGWQLDYVFTGLTPIGGEPSATGDDPYSSTVMRKYLTDYAAKTTYGGDTYWGGKDLLQLAEYMTIAQQIGATEAEQQLQRTLTTALTDWFTYSDGEREHFFARYPTWKALIGFGDSYGSGQFNDNHFHYGYFAVASALLGAVDPGWAERYEGMATKVVQQYANWDRDDPDQPYLRTFGVWTGHSNAGGFSSPGGNNQESSSEAIQSEAGLFLLGTVLGNREMQATGAMQYVTERAAVRDYYQNVRGNPASASYDGTGPFPDAYQHGQAGILFDSGQAEATYFSGDPAWIYGIQWMPTAPWFSYFGWDPAFSRAVMQQMMDARPRVVGQGGVVDGNVGRIQMLTKKWYGVGTYGTAVITEDRTAAIGELQAAIREAERNHPGYVTQRTAANPLYDAATDTLYVSVDASGRVVFPDRWWTPATLPASLVPARLSGADADKLPADWPVASPLLGFLSTDYRADTATIDRLYSVDLAHYEPGRDTAQAAAVFSDMGDALGQVVLGFLAQYDPDTYADIHAALWAAGDPAVTGQSMAGLVYWQAMSNRTVGTEVQDRHTSDPLSQVFRAADGTYSYVLANTADEQRSFDVYDGDRVIGSIAVPAHSQITSHLDARLDRVVVTAEGSPRTIAPGSSTRFTAVGYDQYGATVPLDGLTWHASAGSIAADGTYRATTPTDQATVTAGVGSVEATYRFRVAPAPVLTTIAVTPGFQRVVAGEAATFRAAGRDQYGDAVDLPGSVAWSTTLPGGAVSDGRVTAAGSGAGYVVATSGGVEGSAVVSAVADLPDVARGASVTATSSLGGNAPGKAVDGDASTRWESAHGDDAQDLTVDLGRETDVADVVVTWENAAAATWDLQVADDADGPWRTVQRVTKTTAAPDTVDADTTARFVRVHGVDRLTQYGYSIWDVAVHGTPAAGATTPTTVLVGPRATGLPAGGTTDLTAYAFDASGAGGPVTGADAPTWTVDGGGTVDAHGTVTAPSSGGVTATVTAAFRGVSGTATVTTVGAAADAPEPTVPGAGTGEPRDVALGKPVRTSSDERADLGGDQAVDGDPVTRWSSRADDDAWIAVDLGSVLPVAAVELDWETASADRSRIQVRDTADGDWRTVVTEDHGTGGTETHALDGVRARYVRMLGVQRHTQWGYSLTAFRVMSTEGAPTPDLARRAATSASADESGSVPAGNATDGDPTTRWASGLGDDQWLTVDLGAQRTLHRATLTWEDAYGSAYRIEGRTGTDGPWTTLATVTDGDGGTDTVDLAGSWRQVRFQGVHRATPHGYSLYAFQVR